MTGVGFGEMVGRKGTEDCDWFGYSPGCRRTGGGPMTTGILPPPLLLLECVEGTEYGAGPGIGAFILGRGEFLFHVRQKSSQSIYYVSSLPGMLRTGGVPAGDCEDISPSSLSTWLPWEHRQQRKSAKNVGLFDRPL
jgi:hypothetical protein